MKIIIYGGSFDPIHNGHIKLATEALKAIDGDLLYFVPCYLSPDLKQIKASFADRVEMLKLAISHEEKFRVSEYEKTNEDISYTIYTIKYFKQLYRDDELYILVGSDQYNKLENWKDIDQIRQLVKIICYERLDFPFKPNEQDIFIKDKIINVRSNDVIYNPSHELVNPSVLNYINEKAIYALYHLQHFNLSDYRLNHCIKVANLAFKFAWNYNSKLMQQAFVAGIYHDIAKEIGKEEIENYASTVLKLNNWVSWKVLHAPVGASILQKKFLFTDEEVLNAIANHTIPESDDLLTKILFCADKLVYRENEVFPERKFLIKIGLKNINKCFYLLRQVLNQKFESNNN